MLKDIILVPNYQANVIANLPQLPVDLGRDVRLEKLPRDLAKKVMEACEPRGYNLRPVRQYGQLYTFVRQNPPDNPPLQWDSDSRLQECVAISRLIRPTSIGFECSARLRYTPGGELESIIPGPVGGFGAQAWIAQTGRDWLDANDVAALSKLWRETDLYSMPDRLFRALWYHEYAARTYQAAIRWVLVTTGIEALINTGAERASKQFVTRFCALAHGFAEKAISHTKASRAYELRSRIAHGTGLNDLIQDHRELYSVLEEVLRATIRAGISCRDVQQLFASDQAVEQEWPLPSQG